MSKVCDSCEGLDNCDFPCEEAGKSETWTGPTGTEYERGGGKSEEECDDCDTASKEDCMASATMALNEFYLARAMGRKVPLARCDLRRKESA